MINGKSILITGGTGSFGKRVTAMILDRYRPKRLIIFSRDELKQFEMSQQFPEARYPCIRYFIGDVRDKERLYRALRGVDFVIHAAALKQVPTAEYNPFEAVKTNIIGAQNLINVAIDRQVRRVRDRKQRYGACLSVCTSDSSTSGDGWRCPPRSAPASASTATSRSATTAASG